MLSLEALLFAQVLDHVIRGVAVLGSDLVLDEVRQRASWVYTENGSNSDTTVARLNFVVRDSRMTQHIFTSKGDVLGFFLDRTHALRRSDMNQSILINLVVVDSVETASVGHHDGRFDVLVHGVAVLTHVIVQLTASEN